MTFTAAEIAKTAIEQMFTGLEKSLDKAIAHARETGVDESVYVNWRLTPDMFAMVRQVQIACDIPARGLARLAGADLPAFEDSETDLAQLKERIAKARAFIAALDEEAISASPEADITVPLRDREMTLTRAQFLQNFILPNLYFHVTMAYADLRACGVPLGKADFLARS